MFGSKKDKDNPGEPMPDANKGNDDPREFDVSDHGDDFQAAGQIEDLMKRVDDLQRERDAFQEKYIRTLADYQNSQRRASLNEREAKAQGIRGVVLNILTVLDHFDLALGVDTSKANAEQVVNGVRVIRDELMRTLTSHGVSLVNPAPNDEFDPQKHQAVVQENAEGVEPGRIVRTLQPGYSLDDRLIRPAMVAVKPKE
jgi:molecular chaperone GrpE